MKVKLTQRFPAKAVAVGLFTAAVLLAAACVSALALLTVYAERSAYTFYMPWLEEMAALLAGMEDALYTRLILLIVAGVALFVFLMCAAGRRKGHEEPVLSKLDRVPFDLLLAFFVCACAGLLVLLRALFYHSDITSFAKPLLLPIGLLLAVGSLIVLWLCMTFAARVKTGTLIKNNITSYILRFLWRCAKAVGRGAWRLYKNINILWKAELAYAAFVFLFMVASYGFLYNRGASFLLLFLIVLIGFVCMGFFLIQLKRLQEGAKALAEGNLMQRIDENGLFFECKAHAQSLNGLAAAMDRAVEARMKSERMKTDLITNVSHDIKTPLTSIVNYIDLLQKEPVEGETAKQYLEVLARQAQKLKKLTEDVVEASKASSGALAVNLEPTDAAELLHQSMAEYGERFLAAELTAQVRVQEGLPRILADGRLLWRALDNLLSNALKYSHPGTRVFCEAARSGDGVTLTLKNTSREPLDSALEELTERFVRGDSSRASEGSGLGLSIARSLAELQKGSLVLSADGDLFKAELWFPAA